MSYRVAMARTSGGRTVPVYGKVSGGSFRPCAPPISFSPPERRLTRSDELFGGKEAYASIMDSIFAGRRREREREQQPTKDEANETATDAKEYDEASAAGAERAAFDALPTDKTGDEEEAELVDLPGDPGAVHPLGAAAIDDDDEFDEWPSGALTAGWPGSNPFRASPKLSRKARGGGGSSSGAKKKRQKLSKCERLRKLKRQLEITCGWY